MLPVFVDIDKNNERLVRLVDNLLLITNLEQGKETYKFTANDLNKFVPEIISSFNKSAEQKGLQIQWTVSKIPTGVLISFDEEKIKQVLTTFIENAIGYSTKGIITISADMENDGISLRVKDQGIGFDPVDAANFFQKFHRGHNASAVNVDYGAGLNLYIASKFIEAHDGKVWAKSEGQGKGSEFGFWIPKR
jgi:hypothetical protein